MNYDPVNMPCVFQSHQGPVPSSIQTFIYIVVPSPGIESSRRSRVDRQFARVRDARPRSVPKLGPPSRGPSVVVVQNTTKPFSAGNGAVHLGSGGHLLDQLVVKPLVIALLMVVLRVFLHGLAKVTLAQGDDLR